MRKGLDSSRLESTCPNCNNLKEKNLKCKNNMEDKYRKNHLPFVRRRK